MRYFVKPYYSDWAEVTEDQYNNFIANIRENATAMSSEQKEAYIQQVIRTAEGGGNTAHIERK